MDATFNHTCTQELVVHTVVMIAVAVTLRFALFGCSGVAAHKGAYGALVQSALHGCRTHGQSTFGGLE